MKKLFVTLLALLASVSLAQTSSFRLEIMSSLNLNHVDSETYQTEEGKVIVFVLESTAPSEEVDNAVREALLNSDETLFRLGYSAVRVVVWNTLEDEVTAWGMNESSVVFHINSAYATVVSYLDLVGWDYIRVNGIEIMYQFPSDGNENIYSADYVGVIQNIGNVIHANSHPDGCTLDTDSNSSTMICYYNGELTLRSHCSFSSNGTMHCESRSY